MKLLMGSVAGLLLACSTGPAEGIAVERSAAFEKAIPYAEFRGPLWPEGEQVVVLTAGDEADEGRFVAYGVDAANKDVRYVITGDREEFIEFKTRLSRDVFRGKGACRIDLGQVPQPLPPPVNPGGEPFSEVLRRAHLATADACPR